MPSDQPRNAIVIALDVGKSVSTLHDYEKETFFQSARSCVSWIIQRKIISQSIDVLSLLLIASNASGCPFVGNDYGICGKFDFQVASWDMLKFIEEEVETTDIESNWLAALTVSVEMLKAYEEYNNISCKKVVLFSDLTKPSSDDLDEVIRKIKLLHVELTIIGPEHLQLSDEYDKTEPEVKRKKLDKSLERQEGEKVAYYLWRELPENVCICTFESALKQLCSYTPKPKRPTPWNCPMDIGNVCVNISVIKKTDPKQARKFKTKFAKTGGTAEGGGAPRETAPTVKDTVMHYKHETGQNEEFVDVEVKPEDTVEGFRYGKTIIPFADEDKAAMKYETGPKSFSVVGFTHVSNVPCFLLSGECSYLVVPQDKDKNAEVALSALIQGLREMKCLAIVRRVYSDNRGLSLGILCPNVEQIYSDETNDVISREYLIFIELAFEDDVKFIDFPSLEGVARNVSQQQYEAVDELIDRMNLMRADKGLRGEACEAFDSSFLHDYKEQFFHCCVIQKGLHPDKPLPTSLPAYIESFIKVPRGVEQMCQSAFDDIKTRFKIRKRTDSPNPPTSDPAGQWNGKKSFNEVDGNQQAAFAHQSQAKLENFSESFINEEKNPITRSWMRLFGQGFPTDEELRKVFWAYRYAGEAEASEVATIFGAVLGLIRKRHAEGDPTAYNKWLIGFKNYLRGKEGLEARIWAVIVMERVGLIGKDENQISGFSNEEAAEFLDLDTNTAAIPEKQMPCARALDELLQEQTDLHFD